MAEEIILDKYIVNIDSANANYNDITKYDFYIDIQEAIKNVMYIKILDNNVLLDAHGTSSPDGYINGTQITDLDPIYINLNEYDRMTANIGSEYAIKCFDSIIIDKSSKVVEYDVASSSGATTARLSFSSVKDKNSNGFDVDDPNVFIANPMIPNLIRFNIKLLDKNNNIIDNTNIERFTMKLCIYYSRKKFTMY